MDIEAMEQGTGRYAAPQEEVLTPWEEDIKNYIESDIGIADVAFDWHEGELRFKHTRDLNIVRDHFRNVMNRFWEIGLKPPKAEAMWSVEESLGEHPSERWR